MHYYKVTEERVAVIYRGGSPRHSSFREMKQQTTREHEEHPVHTKHDIQRWNMSIRNLEGLQ